MTTNNKVIQSYVWHGEKCFFVSTIDRDSSSMYGGRYAETLVWDYDYESGERGNIVGQGEGSTGSMHTHFEICKRIAETGSPDKPEDD